MNTETHCHHCGESLRPSNRPNHKHIPGTFNHPCRLERIAPAVAWIEVTEHSADDFEHVTL